jgi:hypothetical protein
MIYFISTKGRFSERKTSSFSTLNSNANKNEILYWMCMEACGNEFNLTNQLSQLEIHKDILSIASYEQYTINTEGQLINQTFNGNSMTGFFVLILFCFFFLSHYFFFRYETLSEKVWNKSCSNDFIRRYLWNA